MNKLTDDLKMASSMEEVPEDLITACEGISKLLAPLHPQTEVSALITLLCRLSVVYGMDRDMVTNAVAAGYDAFALALAPDGPIQ